VIDLDQVEARELAPKAEFRARFQSDPARRTPLKNFASVFRKTVLQFGYSDSLEGRVATVTSVGLECGGRGRIAGRAIWMRTTEACGPGTPGLVLSLRNVFAGDGDYEVTDTGESAHNAVNTIAQGKPERSVYL
jgi:hypothetical protein